MKHLLCILLFFIGLVLAPSLAYAESEGKSAARRYAEHGFDLFKQERHVEAIAQFESAETHFHSPAHLLYIARSNVALGNLVRAHSTYRSIVDEVLEDEVPAAFRRSQEEAKKELEELEPRMPFVTITLRGADSATIELDGAEIASGEHAIDPGEHTATASRDGYEAASASFEIDEGERRDVELVLVVIDESVVEESAWMLPAIISYGVGGAALIIGVVTGAVSLNRAADVEDQCVDGVRCPAALESDADAALALGHASTAMFIIAGVGAAAGTTFLALHLRWFDDDEQVTLRVGPTAIALGGAF